MHVATVGRPVFCTFSLFLPLSTLAPSFNHPVFLRMWPSTYIIYDFQYAQ